MTEFADEREAMQLADMEHAGISESHPSETRYLGYCDLVGCLHEETVDCQNWVPQLDEIVEEL